MKISKWPFLLQKYGRQQVQISKYGKEDHKKHKETQNARRAL
jgi:hypothetical protein